VARQPFCTFARRHVDVPATWPSTAKSRVLLVHTERRILSRGMGASAGLSARGWGAQL
jgi:hypothetical protein